MALNLPEAVNLSKKQRKRGRPKKATNPSDKKMFEFYSDDEAPVKKPSEIICP